MSEATSTATATTTPQAAAQAPAPSAAPEKVLYDKTPAVTTPAAQKDLVTPPVETASAVADAPASTGDPAVGTPSGTANPQSDAKPAPTETPAAEAGVSTAPTKIELKVPKDSLLSAERVKDIEAFAKEQNLTPEIAQKLLDRESTAIASYQKNQQQTFEAKRSEWAKAAASDKEIGGENFGMNVELAKRALTRYGSEALRKELDTTGFGNHPELVRVFSRIGKEMGNDRFIKGGIPTTPVVRSAAEVLYGDSSKK